MTTPKSSTPFKTADLTTPETTNASAGQTIDKRPVSPQPLRLPDELIWHIIESCPPHQIWSLRAVCKLFKRISESVFQEAVVGAGVGFGTYIGMANHDSKGKGKSQRATFKCPKPVISVNVTGCPYACSAPPLNYVMACRAVTKASTGSENSRMAVFDEDAAVENAWWEFRQAQSQNQNTGALSRNEQADAPMDLIEETMEVFGALKNREVADEEVEEADDTLEVETGEAQIQPSASDSDSGTAGNSNSISTSSSSSSSTSEHKPLSGTTVPITKGEARTFFKARTAWGMRKNLLSMQQQHDAVLRQLQHVRETRKSVQELGNILNITRIFALQERLVDSMAQNGRTHFKIALHWQLAMAMANACKSLTVVCGGGTCCDKRVRGELVLRLTKRWLERESEGQDDENEHEKKENDSLSVTRPFAFDLRGSTFPTLRDCKSATCRAGFITSIDHEIEPGGCVLKLVVCEITELLFPHHVPMQQQDGNELVGNLRSSVVREFAVLSVGVEVTPGWISRTLIEAERTVGMV